MPKHLLVSTWLGSEPAVWCRWRNVQTAVSIIFAQYCHLAGAQDTTRRREQRALILLKSFFTDHLARRLDYWHYMICGNVGSSRRQIMWNFLCFGGFVLRLLRSKVRRKTLRIQPRNKLMHSWWNTISRMARVPMHSIEDDTITCRYNITWSCTRDYNMVYNMVLYYNMVI